MANEIVAALIQGVCTIGAAGLAVFGGARALRNYTKEVPGRRRIELAEKLLVAVSETRSALWTLELETKSYLNLLIEQPSVRLAKGDIFNLREQARERLQTLDAVSKTADLYFGAVLKPYVRKVWAAFFVLGQLSGELSEAAYAARESSSTDPAQELAVKLRFKEKLEDIRRRLNQPEDPEGFDYQLRAGVKGLNDILAPHLAQ